jgi:hypothetical protein
MNKVQKAYRFLWRASINIVCISPVSRAMLFPSEKLRQAFGAEDSCYAWRVFEKHCTRLRESGFERATSILEIGPGRNLGTALLFFCLNSSQSRESVNVVCWDVYKNAAPEAPDFWPRLAKQLLNAKPSSLDCLSAAEFEALAGVLGSVAAGRPPEIDYRVTSLQNLAAQRGRFDLVYSHAAIEHVWFIDEFWCKISALTSTLGWHSHRIDLADHGRRDSNYIEMLEWSGWAYWATQRFVPGATNRWRGSDHRRKLVDLGLTVMTFSTELRESLPISKSKLSNPYRTMDDTELRCTAVDVVARRAGVN